MKNLVEFEESKIFISSSIGLAIMNFFLFLNNNFSIIKLFKNKERLELIISELSCVYSFAQLIFCSFFFCIIFRSHLVNATVLNISNLIGIALNIEWLSIYLYFYHNENIIYAIIHLLIPLSIPTVIISLLLTKHEINKISELILINITLIFYIFMFLSPGLNIIKLFKTGNPKFISITNAFIGVFVNFFMMFFIIMLNYYEIISIIFIIYPIVSIIICGFLIVYYFMQKHQLNNLDDIFDKDDKEDNTSKGKQFNLISNDSIED